MRTAAALLLVALCVSCAPPPPKPLTAAHLRKIEATLKARDLDMPKEIAVQSDGFVVAEYEIPSGSYQGLRARAFAEERLRAIYEALMFDGFRDLRVNVNGLPPPGNGVIWRYGSAQFIASRPRAEWVTPDN